ncbi:MAG: ATP-binding cassette domain-containing protein [Acidobacteria bacterium]|nr:ATP-binding cassette domain-containing protein [Acidobacteriota bacterium]
MLQISGLSKPYLGVSAVPLLDHLAVLKGLLDPRERAEQVEALLQLTNLSAVRWRPVSTYSGGMKQRFGIAQALLGRPRLIVVDEPTAGLDPGERNRFHNVLSEIAENVVVILSTHIVVDVSDLCSRMAVLINGRIELQGSPSARIDRLRGRVWRKTVPKSAVAGYRAGHSVISTRLFAGETRIHVLADDRPDAGFDAIDPDLEDVYFAALTSDRGGTEARSC